MRLRELDARDRKTFDEATLAEYNELAAHKEHSVRQRAYYKQIRDQLKVDEVQYALQGRIIMFLRILGTACGGFHKSLS